MPPVPDRVRIQRPADCLGSSGRASPVARTSRGGPTTPQTPSARRLAVSGPPPVPRSTEHRSRLLRVSGRSLVLQADRTRSEAGPVLPTPNGRGLLAPFR
jgi:hypothetical protein